MKSIKVLIINILTIVLITHFSCIMVEKDDSILYEKAYNIILNSDKQYLDTIMSESDLLGFRNGIFIQDSVINLGFSLFVKQYSYFIDRSYMGNMSKRKELYSKIFNIDKKYASVSGKLDFSNNCTKSDAKYILFFSIVKENMLRASLLLNRSDSLFSFYKEKGLYQYYLYYLSYHESIEYFFIFDETGRVILWKSMNMKYD